MDAQGDLTATWLFDPDGTVLEGPDGPVSHLICGGVYDGSTDLIYRDGGYFDPRLGIWLMLAPLLVVQSWRRRKKRRGGQLWVVMVCIGVFAVGAIAGCKPSSAQISDTEQVVCIAPLKLRQLNAGGIKLLLPTSDSEWWIPIATMTRDQLNELERLEGEVGPGGTGHGSGGYEPQRKTIDMPKEYYSLDNVAKLLLSIDSLNSTAEDDIVHSQMSVESYLGAKLRGSWGIERGKSNLTRAKQVREHISNREAMLFETTAAYDLSGHVIDYACGERRDFQLHPVFVLVKGITSDDSFLLFDNPVDADGEELLPISLFIGQGYHALKKNTPPEPEIVNF